MESNVVETGDNNQVECKIDPVNKIIQIPESEGIVKDLQRNNIVYTIEDKEITVSGTNFIDFMGISILRNNIENSMKIIGEPLINIGVWKVDEAAILPSKTRFSDVGFDLTIIAKHKTYGNCTLFDTGIKVQVPTGFYAEIVPRSSLSKTGWMMANSVGVIDASYTGNIYVPLIKVDPNAEDIELPFKAVQLILRKQFYSYLIDVTESNVPSTSRADGGFGSTNTPV